MYIALSVAIICVTTYLLGLKILAHMLEVNKYNSDIKLKIEEPVRDVQINESVIKEIEAIKGQLTGLSLNQGIKRR